MINQLTALARTAFLTLLGTAVLFTATPALAEPAGYRLGYGDALSVTVVGQPDLTILDQPIRPDGRISLPLLKELNVGGKTVTEVTAALNQAFKPFLNHPNVVVAVARFRPLKVTVLGQVRQPGTFDFQQSPTLLDVLAAAGGLTERASRVDVQLISPSGAVQPIDIDSLLRGQAAAIRVEPGSVVEVREVWGPDLYRALPIVASIVTAAALILRNSW